MICHFILYVRDQTLSTRFYKQILNMEPTLNVPGMTEFKLAENCILGLMPEKGIKNLLGAAIKDPETTNGVARAELYLRVPNPTEFIMRAKNAGAPLLSAFAPRNWGDSAGYISDPDGHVVAFACPI
jgi:uncharacterized glyoxalase superfamily protein PhnB